MLDLRDVHPLVLLVRVLEHEPWAPFLPGRELVAAAAERRIHRVTRDDVGRAADEPRAQRGILPGTVPAAVAFDVGVDRVFPTPVYRRLPRRAAVEANEA